MTSRLPTLPAAVVVVALLVSCGSEPQAADTSTLTVFTDVGVAAPVQRLVEAFEETNPGVRLEVVSAPTPELADRVRGDEQADIFIGQRLELDQLDAEGVIQGDALLLGSDLVEIAVPPGNPANVTGLDAFLAASPIRTAICAENTTSGAAARRVFRDAFPDAAPDQTDMTPVSLLLQLSARTVDAGILWRSQISSAPEPLDTVPLPAEHNQRQDFTIAGVEDNETVELAVLWLATDLTSNTLLSESGLRPRGEDSGS